ncbi:MAG: DinB family protein [Acidobacteriota bacterium]|nr:DinB family protein [Acidobacteriota bacterium]
MATGELEPWMRGTYGDVPAVLRAVIHALEQAEEDLHRWCGTLTDAEWNLQPHEMASVAFHVRHLAGSTDRLLTYAEGKQLSSEQLETMRNEGAPLAVGAAVITALTASLAEAKRRVKAFADKDLEAPRALGRKQLPTSVGGLLVHVAEHAARHVGQAVTTTRVVIAQRGSF